MASDTNLIEVGAIIRDNDPRMPNRELCIVGFESGLITAHGREVKAVCELTGVRWKRQFRINVRSIHTDGKPRRSGFSLVSAVGSPATPSFGADR
jgi:hypothetical protein